MKGMVKLFINFKKLLAHQPEVKLQETKNTVGSIVRWERKRRNMTLHEGAEGICSVSYLSKVENSLIEPSEQILDNLKKRLEIETLIDFDLQDMMNTMTISFKLYLTINKCQVFTMICILEKKIINQN